MKQEKDVLEVNSCFSSHYILFIWYKAETSCFSVNHAGKNFFRYNLKVKEGKFGTDGTNGRRMDSLLQQQ